MRPVATVVAWSVCPSVGHERESGSRAKAAEPIEVLFSITTPATSV